MRNQSSKRLNNALSLTACVMSLQLLSPHWMDGPDVREGVVLQKVAEVHWGPAIRWLLVWPGCGEEEVEGDESPS